MSQKVRFNRHQLMLNFDVRNQDEYDPQFIHADGVLQKLIINEIKFIPVKTYKISHLSEISAIYSVVWIQSRCEW